MAVSIASAKPWYGLSILGPYSIAVTGLTTVSCQVIGADAARNGIFFHNPGTAAKRVMPAGSALAGGSGGILIYPQSDFILLQEENSQWNVNCAWNAVTDDNADGALTILNFTPNTPGAPEVQPTMRVAQQIPVNSPVGFPNTNLAAGSIPILGADPNRNGVIFQNPGTIVAAVCPSNLAAVVGAGSIIILPGAEKRIIGNDRVKVNCGWNGISQSGINNSLTALGLYG
jgi:hypothetical protein